MDINYLLFLQRAREACGGIFDSVFLLASELAKQPITFLLFAFTYWCVDKRIGAAMGWNIGLGCIMNTTLKKIFRVERPWIRDARIQPVESALPDAGGYSFPSGHTTRAMATWGVVGAYFRSGIRYLCYFLVLSIAFSRNYLGVHTLKDVLTAVILGVALLACVHYVLQWADLKQGRFDFWIAIGGMVFCFLPMLRFGCMGNCGFGMGFAAGWYIERRFIRFDVGGSNTIKAIRFGAGAIPLICIIKILPPLLALYMQGKYVSFLMQGILAIFVSVLYPLIFKKVEENVEKKKKRVITTAIVSFLILVAVVAFAGYARMRNNMEVIGHRGYPAVAPENTIPSFEAAINLGVDWVETDVQMTRDGVLVLFHDKDLKRITGNEGAISDYTYDELMQMDFGSWFSEEYAGTKIPTLEEFFGSLHDNDVHIYLELKDIGDVEGFTREVYDMVEASGLDDRVVYASFNYNYLLELREMDANNQILLNTREGTTAILTDTPADYYGVSVKSISNDLVKAIHKSGSKVFVWTPDDQQLIQNLYYMGVDGVCTNHPEIALKVRHP